MSSEAFATAATPPMLNPTDLQRHTLRLYAELLSRHGSLAGTLTLAHGPQSSSTGLAAAVSIAGGTSLLIDPDLATVKATFRTGGLDFLVTNLDEALRVLKNEIRKRTPLSVALTAYPATVLAEMRDRGVQPDLEVSASDSPDSLALTQIHLPAAGLTPHAADWLASHEWSEARLPTETTAGLRALDAHLLTHLADAPRRQWLTRISHYQRIAPDSGRAVWLAPAERENAVKPPGAALDV